MDSEKEPIFDSLIDCRFQSLSKDCLAALLADIDNNLPVNWSKSETKVGGPWEEHVYIRQKYESHSFKFVIVQKIPSELHLLHIVNFADQDGVQYPETTADWWQRHLQVFLSEIAKPFAERHPEVKLVVERKNKGIEDFASLDVCNKLRAFVRRSKGSSTKFESREWFRFLFQAYEDQVQEKLTYSILREYLIQCGWPEDKAERDCSRYDFGLELLEAYDEHLGEKRKA